MKWIALALIIFVIDRFVVGLMVSTLEDNQLGYLIFTGILALFAAVGILICS